MNDDAELFSAICLAARQGGAVARLLQGKVHNEEKGLDADVKDESEKVRAMHAAKTIVDEAVQEIILLAIADSTDPSTVLIDAEEETPMLKRFPAIESNLSIIIDPVDGTLEYLNGMDNYSVCIGVVENNKIRIGIVFFAARDIAYGIGRGRTSYRYESFSTKGIESGSEISLPPDPKRIVYKTRSVPAEIEERFTRAGFEVRANDSYSVALLEVLHGEAAGYIACAPQMRDILIGPVIGLAKGGFMCDLHNKELIWPQKGRISEAFFGNSALEKELRSLLY